MQFDFAAYKSLYNKYIQSPNLTVDDPNCIQENGRLLQIFTRPDKVDELAYTSKSAGPVMEFEKEGKKHHKFSKIIPPLRNNTDNFVKNYIPKSDYESILEIQGRIFLKPDKISNPNHVEIIDYWRHPLKEKSLKKYNEELTSLIKHDLSSWLQKYLKVPKDAFYSGIPSLQKLHTYVAQGEVDPTHNLMQAMPSSLPYFIEVGNLSMVKNIVQQNPDIDLTKRIVIPNNSSKVSQENCLPILAAYKSENYALIDYFFKQTYLKKDISQEYLRILLGIAICDNGTEKFDLLIKQHPNIDLEKLDSKIFTTKNFPPQKITTVIASLAKIDDVKKRRFVAKVAAQKITQHMSIDSIKILLTALVKAKDPETFKQIANLLIKKNMSVLLISDIITALTKIKDPNFIVQTAISFTPNNPNYCFSNIIESLVKVKQRESFIKTVNNVVLKIGLTGEKATKFIVSLAEIDDVVKRQSVAEAVAQIITHDTDIDSIENLILSLAKVKDVETFIKTANLLIKKNMTVGQNLRHNKPPYQN